MKRSLLGSWIPGLASIVLAAGCATPVHTDYKTGANFSQYHTFALMPLPQRSSAEDPGLILRLAQPAREAVVGELTAKGLSEAATDKADLEVNLRGESLPKVEVRNYGYTYPVMTRYGTFTVVNNPYTSVSSYTERTLIIEMFDNRSKELVWVGWLKKSTSGKVTPEALQQAIREILAKYPPATAAAPNK